MKIVFATSNAHKIQEINQILPPSIEIIPMSEAGYSGELAETSNTIAGNAIQKATALENILDTDCFAEDTGLEIDALGGHPGVMTARYGGPERDAKTNMQKVLDELDGAQDRTARFRTVIALIIDSATYCFHGIVEGSIAMAPRGTGGFGYDPIFIPEGYDQTFAELSDAIKNEISHRARATHQLVTFLTTYATRKNLK